jgi:glutamate-1-semialdehyde 2,1-aminomutase
MIFFAVGKEIGMDRSQALYQEALKYIPGGVNSPVRAYKSVGGHPLYIDRAKGSRIFDADGREYIDYVCSWGPLILGHADQRIVDAVCRQAARGTSFGANTEIEVKLAKLITEIYPSIERVRMVSSGTEAAMSAVRLARAFTGKDKIVKFDGCYHGHSDSFLIRGGSGLLTLGISDSPGVTKASANDTLVAKFNDIGSVEKLIVSNKGQIAAIILEPILGNIGVIPPQQDFLAQLRRITQDTGIVLVFDEVITGFRVALGGAQQLHGIKPDLTCLGKIIGGGLPVGAFGGRADIMKLLAPEGPVYQAGTLSGNPVAMTAGYETISILKQTGTYETLEERSALLAEGLIANARRLGVECQLNRVGSMMSTFFTGKGVGDTDSARTADNAFFTKYFLRMLANGVYIAPSQFEASFVSLAHTGADIEKTVAAHYESLKEAQLDR